ncbi:MAG: peptidyl-prolyl cis-trans isomerase [Deltaproteobacteria bacterium]|nr:peptidyl-prolyl cis-trans isomerase [Deltaproteobacteria bacterium]
MASEGADGGFTDVALEPDTSTLRARPLGRCPLGIERPEEVLARVGAVELTRCDVAVRWQQRLREGLRVDDPRALLHELVDEALLASRAVVPARDPELDAIVAEALLRRETLAALGPRVPSEAAVERYYREHPEEFRSPARHHLQGLCAPTQRAAEALRRRLLGGEAFSALVAGSTDPNARRDGGDLGFVTADTTGLPEALVRAAMALQTPGEVAPRALPVTTVVTPPAQPARHGRRRRPPRPRRVSAWWVLQLVERLPEEVVPFEAARRGILSQLTRGRYNTLRRETRARLREVFSPATAAAISPGALRQVRPPTGASTLPGRPP